MEHESRMAEEARRLFAGPCDFVLGVKDLVQLPGSSTPEVAFAGRSNVGKSTLLNALTGRKSLARISHTPGRTQQLNFFNMGGAFYLVDMPGYGYAKVSKKMRKEWDELIFTYLSGRPNLRTVFVLADSRHGLKENDIEVLKLLDKAAVSCRIVLTKVDKADRKELEKTLSSVKETLKKHPAAFPEIIQTSSHNKEGIEELRGVIFARIR